jgi:hypothetical protein
MDQEEREYLVQQRRWLINRMRADQDMVRAIERRLDLKPMNNNGRPEAKIAAQR